MTSTVDPAYMALGGLVGDVPVRAEKGEVIVLEDGSTFKTNASKKHKHQKSNAPTDILPPGAFMLSNDKRMRISRKEADKMILGQTPAVYSEGEPGQAPKDIKLSDIFPKGRNHASPADLMREIEKKYPRTDRENDVFAKNAIEANTLNRDLFTKGVIALNLLKKLVLVDQL